MLEPRIRVGTIQELMARELNCVSFVIARFILAGTDPELVWWLARTQNGHTERPRISTVQGPHFVPKPRIKEGTIQELMASELNCVSFVIWTEHHLF